MLDVVLVELLIKQVVQVVEVEPIIIIVVNLLVQVIVLQLLQLKVVMEGPVPHLLEVLILVVVVEALLLWAQRITILQVVEQEG